MLDKNGRLFFIGSMVFPSSFRIRYGIRRERSRFFCPPDVIQTMGGLKGPDFESFLRFCCQAFLILRRNIKELITFISTTLPNCSEFRKASDLHIFEDFFQLDLDSEEATRMFVTQFRKHINNASSYAIHNLPHILVHK